MDARLESAGLTDREVQAMSLYFFDRCTQTEIGNVFGISRPGVSKLLSRAVDKLKAAGLPEPKRIGNGVDNRPMIFSMDPHTLDLLPSGS